MELEDVAEKLERERQEWLRGKEERKTKGVRFRDTHPIARNIIYASAAIATAAFFFFVGYSIVNSGGKIIDRYTDELSAYYIEEMP